MQSERWQRFSHYLPILMCREAFPLSLHHLEGLQSQFVFSDWVGSTENKGAQPHHSVLLCPRCQKSAAQTTQQLLGTAKAIIWVRNRCHYPACNQNSNYKKLLCKHVDYTMLITHAQCGFRMFKCHLPLSLSHKAAQVSPPVICRAMPGPRVVRSL